MLIVPPVLFQALIKFIAEAHRGLHGFVFDVAGNPVEKASLKIKSRDVGFQTTKFGEFWRILLPGMYKLEVKYDKLLQVLFLNNDINIQIHLIKFYYSDLC